MAKKEQWVLKVLIDAEGQVVDVKKKGSKGEEKLMDSDYSPDEKRRIDAVGVLATSNWCTWKLIGGRWVCV